MVNINNNNHYTSIFFITNQKLKKILLHTEFWTGLKINGIRSIDISSTMKGKMENLIARFNILLLFCSYAIGIN